MEYDTFRRFNLPIHSIIGNDGKWNQILRDQVTILGAPTACLLDQSTRYDKVAEGWGAKGYLCESTEDVERAIKEAQGDGSKGACLNVIVGRSDFREGSVSV